MLIVLKEEERLHTLYLTWSRRGEGKRGKIDAFPSARLQKKRKGRSPFLLYRGPEGDLGESARGMTLSLSFSFRGREKKGRGRAANLPSRPEKKEALILFACERSSNLVHGDGKVGKDALVCLSPRGREKKKKGRNALFNH